jgi:hypothetical protein
MDGKLAAESQLLRLDEVESMLCFMLHLWQTSKTQRVRAFIPDTIIFKQGYPLRWLFTSDKSQVS